MLYEVITRAGIYVNDNQSYSATVLEPQTAFVSPYGGTTTLVFEYVVPEDRNNFV